MDFGQALWNLKNGNKVRRKGWNGKGIFIDSTGLQTDNINAPKNRVPWFASQTDMLSDDWEVCE